MEVMRVAEKGENEGSDDRGLGFFGEVSPSPWKNLRLSKNIAIDFQCRM